MTLSFTYTSNLSFKKNILFYVFLKKLLTSYPIPAPSSRTSFPLTDGSIPKTSGCSCCVRTSALLSSIISSTLCAVECLFQNSVICSRVWGFGSTRSVTEIAETLNHHMTWMAPRTISLENHMKRKSRIWGPCAMIMRQVIGLEKCIRLC